MHCDFVSLPLAKQILRLQIYCSYSYANVSRRCTDQLVTLNMHMHCHLAECVCDYGPLRSYWLFPYGRYNGIMEGTPTNNRSVEVQIMQ